MARRLTLSYVTVPRSTVPLSCRKTELSDTPLTSSSKTAVIEVSTETPVAPSSGLRPITVGLVVSPCPSIEASIGSTHGPVVPSRWQRLSPGWQV